MLNPIYVRRENYKCLDISCSRHRRHPRTQGPANSFRFYPTPFGLLPHYLIILISLPYLILIYLLLIFSPILFNLRLFLSFYRKLFNIEIEPPKKKEQGHLRINNSTGSNNHLRCIDLFKSMMIRM